MRGGILLEDIATLLDKRNMLALAGIGIGMIVVGLVMMRLFGVGKGE